MKLTLLNVSVSTGLSKANQSPFKMVRALALAPFDAANSKSFQRQGSGMSTLEVVIADSFYEELERFFNYEFALKKFPVVVHVETSLVRRGQGSETMVTEFTEDFMSKHSYFKEPAKAA